jgi:IclR family transcriptional regulator, acetate operon repressor
VVEIAQEAGERDDTVIRSVERALRLLVVAAEAHDGIGLVDASRAVDLAPSTVSRLLRTLESTGFVRRRDDGNYESGAELARLGALLGSESPLLRSAQPHLDSLAADTGESCYLALAIDDDWATYVRMAESSRAVRHVSWLGRRIPRHGSAVGAALDDRVDRNGAAVVHAGVEADTTAVAVPVHVDGVVVAAINVVGPRFRMTRTVQNAIACAACATAGDLQRAVSNQ